VSIVEFIECIENNEKRRNPTGFGPKQGQEFFDIWLGLPFLMRRVQRLSFVRQVGGSLPKLLQEIADDVLRCGCFFVVEVYTGKSNIINTFKLLLQMIDHNGTVKIQ